jgi:hypothetical protein
MGLSLRLFSAGGDVFVPTAIRDHLAALYDEGSVEAEILRRECRFDAFHSSDSIQVPYDVLPRLRAMYIVATLDPRWRPKTGDEAIRSHTYDQFLDGGDSVLYTSSHLCNHGDSDGVYIPVHFDQVHPLEGTFSVGSTPHLIDELAIVGRVLDLPDDAAVASYLTSKQPSTLELEKHLFCALWELARLSMKHCTAIVFS